MGRRSGKGKNVEKLSRAERKIKNPNNRTTENITNYKRLKATTRLLLKLEKSQEREMDEIHKHHHSFNTIKRNLGEKSEPSRGNGRTIIYLYTPPYTT
jgi:hypothetical protein